MEKLENWKQRPLSQVVSRWIRGTTLNRSKTDYYTKDPQPESLPWTRVGDIKEEYISKTENYLTKEGADQIPWLVVPEGAVLLSVSGTIGKAAIAGCDMVVNQAIQAMVFDEEQVLPEKEENDFFVPVLSRAEQAAFEKTIQKAETIRKRLQKMQQLGARYFKSMLSLAFTAGLTEEFRKQEDLADPSPSLFMESYGIGTVRSVSQPTEGITDWQSRIPKELQSLFTMLSDFQMEILQIYAQSQEAIPVHTVFKQIHKKGYSVQDAGRNGDLRKAPEKGLLRCFRAAEKIICGTGKKWKNTAVIFHTG